MSWQKTDPCWRFSSRFHEALKPEATSADPNSTPIISPLPANFLHQFVAGKPSGSTPAEARRRAWAAALDQFFGLDHFKRCNSGPPSPDHFFGEGRSVHDRTIPFDLKILSKMLLRREQTRRPAHGPPESALGEQHHVGFDVPVLEPRGKPPGSPQWPVWISSADEQRAVFTAECRGRPAEENSSVGHVNALALGSARR